MSRFFKKITLEEFKEKMEPIMNPGEDADDQFPDTLPATVHKDLKVSFDYENCNVGNAYYDYNPKYERQKSDTDYPEGYHVLPNGMPCMFVWAGGDWEYPVCYVVYFDGSKLRGYVPSKGNLWNRKTKIAFGNEYGETAESMYKMYKGLLKEAKEWTDSKGLVLVSTLTDELEEIKDDSGELEEFYQRFDKLVSTKAIITDITERILLK